MYKVYQDPEGTGCLEKSRSTVVVNKTAVSSDTDESYKKSIEGLNRRIKTLRDELKKVVVKEYSSILHYWSFLMYFSL